MPSVEKLLWLNLHSTCSSQLVLFVLSSCLRPASQRGSHLFDFVHIPVMFHSKLTLFSDFFLHWANCTLTLTNFLNEKFDMTLFLFLVFAYFPKAQISTFYKIPSVYDFYHKVKHFGDKRCPVSFLIFFINHMVTIARWGNLVSPKFPQSYLGYNLS